MYTKQYISKPLFVFITLISAVGQLLFFKLFYPYPNFIPDSYNYLRCAENKDYVDTWPIGYALYIRLVGYFSHNDNVLIFFQFLSYILSALYFYLILIRHINPWAITRILVFIMLFVNPIILFIANYILSDILFLSLSLIWITQLFIIINSQCISHQIILAHGIIILLSFMTRYQASIYPIISTISIFLTALPAKSKKYGIACILIPLSIFIFCNIIIMKKKTGTAQFSAFSGWQIANNAIYAYSYEPSSIRHTTSIPTRFKNIHLIVDNYIDSISQMPNFKDRPIDAGFIWSTSSPLQRFAQIKIQPNNTSDFIQMSKFAPLYNSYGSWIIRNFPITYFKNYVFPNFILFGNLPIEALGTYNCGSDSIEDLSKNWFNYKSSLVTHTELKWISSRLWIYSFLTPIIVIIQFFTFFYSSILTEWKKSSFSIYKIQLLTFLFTILNVIFSILASPIVLRYQIFNILISVVITSLTLNSVFNYLKQKKE